MSNDALQKQIEQAGGLTTLTRYAQRHDVSKQRLHALAKHPDFPAPVFTEGRIALYLVAEIDSFRATERPVGRPRNKETEPG